jgi:hypothetical protein
MNVCLPCAFHNPNHALCAVHRSAILCFRIVHQQGTVYNTSYSEGTTSPQNCAHKTQTLTCTMATFSLTTSTVFRAGLHGTHLSFLHCKRCIWMQWLAQALAEKSPMSIPHAWIPQRLHERNKLLKSYDLILDSHTVLCTSWQISACKYFGGFDHSFESTRYFLFDCVPIKLGPRILHPAVLICTPPARQWHILHLHDICCVLASTHHNEYS